MTSLKSDSRYFQWFRATALAVFIFSCSENNDPAPPQAEADNLVEAVKTGSRSAAELQFFIQLSGRDISSTWFSYDVDIYNVVYTTVYQDTEIEASGLVILPKTTTPVPMLSFQHGTIVRQSDAPSVLSKSSEEVVSYTALASMGFITVVPDLIGFGKSNDIFHPYYIEAPTATAVTDLIRAAGALAKEKEMAFDNRLFLAGYSQGGYATLATHKAIESDPPEGFELIASFAGAGGYDLASLKDYFFGLTTYNAPYYLAYIGMGYQSYYGEETLIEHFFDTPYADRIPGLFDGVKSPADINAQLTTEIGALVNDAVLDDIEGSPTAAFLEEKFRENSLVDWVPSVPVFLYHGDADLTVPYENSEITYQKLLANGAAPENLQLITLPGKTHVTAVEPFVVDIIKKLQEFK